MTLPRPRPRPPLLSVVRQVLCGGARVRGAAIGLLFLLLPAESRAQGACQFHVSGSEMRLLGDCVTRESIEIPDGMVFDGDFHTVAAIDPPGGSFEGAVILARGALASVVNTAITTSNLRNVCHEGSRRLRGIYFEGASGVIRGNAVHDIRMQDSACEEGTAIEVRNPGLDSPPMVTIESNVIDRYQKSGIVLYGRVEARVWRNAIGASAAQLLLAANSIQVGPLAHAFVEENTILGNSHPSAAVAGTAILLVATAPGTRVSSNAIFGNADVGIHVLASRAIVTGNELLDEGPDGFWDVGIVNLGTGNVIAGNVVEGYRSSYHDDGGGPPPDGGGQRLE